MDVFSRSSGDMDVIENFKLQNLYSQRGMLILAVFTGASMRVSFYAHLFT